MSARIFVDFDGTITTHDVGNALFRTFGGAVCAEYIRQYHEGAISAQECFRAEAAAAGAVDKNAVRRFLAEQTIDGGFPAFVEYCRSQDFPLCVLSDGLDLYIAPLLERAGNVPFVSNRATIDPRDGTLRLEFPHANAECDRCACCKRNIMLTGTPDDDVLVYIGEGYSDRCPAGYADVVFAKDTLQTYCREQNISYHPYTTFDDVRRTLRSLVERRRLRRRYRAAVRRREVFVAEA
jgi:2,3-diketo-5-methylthio-1-phosphopentane phosphatase